MKHPERVEDYLEHIAEAITRFIEHLDDCDFEGLRQDRRGQNAIIRNIEFICLT